MERGDRARKKERKRPLTLCEMSELFAMVSRMPLKLVSNFY